MWDAFKDLVFSFIALFHGLCGDWGLAIILITIILRLVLLPLTVKQTKSAYRMKKIQPLLADLQRRLKDDPMRLREEQQKLYAEAKFNPIGGCFPMLLQAPVFMALFQVLREMSSRSEVDIAEFSFYNVVPSLVNAPVDAFGQGIGPFIPYLILMIIFALGTFFPMFLQQRDSTAGTKNQMLIMMGVMSLIMLYVGWTSPAGVLLYWGMSSIIAIVLNQVLTSRLRRKEAQKLEEAEAVPVVVDVTRKAKKARPTKKSK